MFQVADDWLIIQLRNHPDERVRELVKRYEEKLHADVHNNDPRRNGAYADCARGTPRI
jgi:hypothetical protein